ncbi:MAG: efflux RND transporter periplasmic adaptor subunit [Xanthomonadales bacterium PRO6]|nr:Multidrug resistance protein MdtA [Xanthomonadales bacterium]MCE7931188.1 efflux RND transporter periplasmic adaptor subunit [Xanthomonadales bacterium PRO6]
MRPTDSLRSWLIAFLLLPAACSGPDGKSTGYRTAKLDRGTVAVRISATGTLRALSTVDVGTQVSGQVLEVAVDYNDRVSAGQVIARIDPANFQTRLTQAQADLTSARASRNEAQTALRLAEAELKRKREVAARQLISASELDVAQAARDQASARVGSAQAAVEQRTAAVADAQLDVEYTVIKSPVDGVILLRSVEPGQTVAASFQTPVLFRIAEDLTRMQIDLSIDEADVGQVREGLPVRFTVDAYPNRSFEGTVHQIRLSATAVANVVTYPVVVAVANPDLKLLPGMTANAEIQIASRSDALRVPNAALRFKPEGIEAPAAGGMPGGGGAIFEELRKIAAELHPDAGQQALLDAAIDGMRARFEQRRQAMAASGAQTGGSGAGGGATTSAPTPEMRERMRRMFGEAMAPFRDSLDASQRQHWDAELELLANARRVTLWLLREGKPVAASVRAGVSDGTHTEVIGGDLVAGTEVIVGAGAP